MYVDASLNLQMGYYNSKLAVWEPLIEPNEYYNEAHRFVAPWELKFEVSLGPTENNNYCCLQPKFGIFFFTYPHDSSVSSNLSLF